MRRFFQFIWVLTLFMMAGTSCGSAKEKKVKTTEYKNHLVGASSPYLLAHVDNPVDWYQWGEEAFAKAIAEDKPIFLSIGYNACHWCHVMEHESFENEEVAALLNKYFVSIKVDREERPDIDQIYMSAVQALTGSGGWPMSVFLTPEKKPFFAGTYFPPEDRYGRPGFKKIIAELGEAYKTQRADIYSSAQSIVDHLSKASQQTFAARAIDKNVIVSGAEAIYGSFDSRYGGFGGAPKFPMGTNMSLMFRAAQMSGNKGLADAAFLTLRKMAEGGIYDHLGGGFHRYSTDAKWLVPHFEKMLYDNALLTIPYLEAYQYSGDEYYLDVVNGILGYLQREMTGSSGGIYATQDADSEGEEGIYYTWTKPEVSSVLGSDADWYFRYYGITNGGNFEHGRTILHLGDHSDAEKKRLGLSDKEFASRLKSANDKLLAIRSERIPPSTDDKILASWNGLAISAFAQAYQVTGTKSYLKSARASADFVLDNMADGDLLYHSYREGSLLRIHLLEDYAYFTAALIDLYQATFDEKYLDRAIGFSRKGIELFEKDRIFYSSPGELTGEGAVGGAEDLIFRPRDLTDGATPSPAFVMILSLLRLHSITGDEALGETAQITLEAVSGIAAQSPRSVAMLLVAGCFALEEPIEIVITGPDRTDEMERYNREIFSRFIPNKVVVGALGKNESNLPLLEGRPAGEELTYYFCRNRACRLPVTSKEELLAELNWITGQEK